MPWNWQLPNWPHFTYDSSHLIEMERKFLLLVGRGSAYLKTVEEQDYKRFLVEILSSEGAESARIEGEVLDRESLQSSIRRQFGMDAKVNKGAEKEWRMAQLLRSVYDTFSEPLSDAMLCHWHAILFNGSLTIDDRGKYRTHEEPMQIVSNRSNSVRVYFEAPPSKAIPEEMKKYIDWFNSIKPSPSILGKAALAHVYFESIHPFEDGNGRIGRVLSEKILAQGIGRPLLIAISHQLEKRKKEYYSALERCNQTLTVDHWVQFFAEIILEAHSESMILLTFLIEKTKMLQKLSGEINPRQMKVLLRMFEEGPIGFRGGLSAENYVSITNTTRATATRDLSDLVKKGALLKKGRLRHTRYQLNICVEPLLI